MVGKQKCANNAENFDQATEPDHFQAKEEWKNQQDNRYSAEEVRQIIATLGIRGFPIPKSNKKVKLESDPVYNS